jgi:hypothetical protein
MKRFFALVMAAAPLAPLAPLSRCARWLSLAALPFALSLTLSACADENAPETWVKRLDDPAQRVVAITRISSMFEKAMGDSKQNYKDPNVTALLDKSVEPLAKVYAGTPLDEKTRKLLIKLIADMHDPRGGIAFAKAFDDFEPKKNEEDVMASAQAMTNLAKEGKTIDPKTLESFWNCFAKVQPSKVASSRLFKDVAEGILAVKHPSWAPQAVLRLAVKVVNPKDPSESMDQLLFAQATSIRLLSELKYGPAARPLVSVLLTPSKADLRSLATNALLKMPKEAEPLLIAALSGTDTEFAKLGEAFGPQKPHLAFIADTLAYASRPAGRDAILDALSKATNDAQRTIMAQSLIRFPSDKKVVDAYLAAYSKIPPNASIELMQGLDAHAVLCQASSHFYQPALTTWLLKEISTAKGEQADAMHLYALEAAVKLMGPAQVQDVGAAVSKFGTPREKAMFDNASKALTQCKEDASCYVGLLDQPVASTPDTAKYFAVKATWMAAAYGNAKTKTDLVAKLDKIRDGALRLSVVEAIDHLAPAGDEATAKALEKIVEADIASGSKELIGADDALAKVALKLRARALP